METAAREASHRWAMLSLGWLIYFSFGLTHTAIAPLVAPVMRDLNLSYTQMGSVTGAWQLVYIFSAQPLGMIIDRLGIHRSLFLGAAIVTASSILRGLATTFEALFASIALFGLGGPMISIGTPKLVSTWFRGHERGTASGINASGSVLGSVAALALTNSAALPLVGHWRNVFYLYGVIDLSIALTWLLLGNKIPPRNTGQTTAETSTDAMRRRRTGELLRHRGVWLIVTIGVVSFLTTHSLQNWLPRILELTGLSPVIAGYAASLMTLSGVLGSLAVPRYLYQPRRRAVTVAVMLVASGIAILLIGVGEAILLWVGILLAGFFTRALLPVLTVALMDLPEVGAERMGLVGGLFFSVGEVGGFLGPFLMGYLKDATGSFLAGVFFLTVVTWATTIAAAFLRSEDRRQ